MSHAFAQRIGRFRSHLASVHLRVFDPVNVHAKAILFNDGFDATDDFGIFVGM